jgi:tetratricopeptide (TPR) repeat protein
MQQDFLPGKAQLIEEGDNHFKEHHYKEALAAYERAIELDPRDATLYYLKGTALGRLGEKELALAAYERATELDPAYAAAYFEQGKLCRRLGWNRKALAALEQALRLDPENAYIPYQTGGVLNTVKRYIEALAMYERVIALDPTMKWAYVRRARVIGQLQGTEAMLAAFDDEITRASDTSFLLAQKAHALQEIQSALPPEQQAEQQEAILAIYDQILQQYPVDVYTAAKNKALYERDPRDSVFAAKGNLLLSLKRYEEAMEAFEGFILCGCCLDCVWYALHEWMLNAPELPVEAWAAYDRLIQRSEHATGIYNMLASMLEKLERHEEARAIRKHMLFKDLG